MRVIDELDELTELVTGADQLYLRYSAGPERDAEHPSRDHEAGVDLPGLPVTTVRPEPWWPRPPADWVARRVCKYLDLAETADDRFAWLLRGKVAGEGPDHEPLITEPDPVARLGDRLIEQARGRYHARFDVGRTSTGGTDS